MRWNIEFVLMTATSRHDCRVGGLVSTGSVRLILQLTMGLRALAEALVGAEILVDVIVFRGKFHTNSMRLSVCLEPSLAKRGLRG
jgi:hypothetical protein